MEGREEERTQNNWFCRYLERVQTGQLEPQSVNGAQGIQLAALNASSFNLCWVIWLVKIKQSVHRGVSFQIIWCH